MNLKFYSTFLCVLLAGSFVHELRAHPNSRVIRETEVNIFDMEFQIINDVMVIYNATTHDALAIGNGVSLLLDGQGAGIVIDRSAEKGRLIASGLWNESETSLKDFMKSINIKELIDGQSDTFDLKETPQEAIKKSAQIIKNLTVFIESNLDFIKPLPLNLAIAVSNGIEDLLKGTLKKIKHSNTEPTKIPKGIASVLSTLTACAKFLQALGEEIPLDLSSILSSRNGLEALSRIISESKYFIVFSKLKDLLNDPKSLLLFISQLGGYITVYNQGTTKVLGEIIGMQNTLDSLVMVIGCTVQTIAWDALAPTIDLQKKHLEDTNKLIDTVKDSDENDNLKKMIKHLESYTINLAQEENFDLSAIAELIESVSRGTAKQPLLNIVKILQQLRPVVELERAAVVLLYVLIGKLATPVGIEQIKAAGINLNLEDVMNEVPSARVSKEDVYTSLVNIEVIVDIIQSVEAALSDATNKKVQLKDILNSLNEEDFNILSGIVKIITKSTQEVSSEALDKAQKVIEGVNSIESLYNIKVEEIVHTV